MHIYFNWFWIIFLTIVLIGFIVYSFNKSRNYKDELDNKKDIHFKDKDVEITSEAFKKIGEVKNGTPNEILLNRQNVQNNTEIFAHDKKFEQLEERIDHLEKYVQDMNDKIQNQLDIILRELQNRG